MIGVNFQPGGGFQGGPQQKPGGNSNGIQEAIKVLSLRLPRVVGAQAISPQGLLGAPGAQGNRVDSVVNQVLSRMFPSGGQMTSPSFGTAPEPQMDSGNAPSFSGGYGQTPYQPPQAAPFTLPSNFNPRIVFDGVGGTGDTMTGPDGRPLGSGGLFGGGPGTPLKPVDGGSQPPATIAPTPPWPQFNPYTPPGESYSNYNI